MAITTLFMAALGLAPVRAQQANTTTLAALRNQKRVLLVFSNGDNQLSEQQLTIAADHAADFRERDLLLAGLSGSNPDVPTTLLSAPDDRTARRRFHVESGKFTVILLGKDGGEKLRSHAPISWAKLQSTIDAMPMRQDEMRR